MWTPPRRRKQQQHTLGSHMQCIKRKTVHTVNNNNKIILLHDSSRMEPMSFIWQAKTFHPLRVLLFQITATHTHRTVLKDRRIWYTDFNTQSAHTEHKDALWHIHWPSSVLMVFFSSSSSSCFTSIFYSRYKKNNNIVRRLNEKNYVWIIFNAVFSFDFDSLNYQVGFCVLDELNERIMDINAAIIRKKTNFKETSTFPTIFVEIWVVGLF